jgi:hypothetical protein
VRTASPHLTDVLHAERAGSRRASQDRLVILPTAVAVLDGASGPPSSGRDGGWYAGVLAAELAARLPDHGRRLADVLADAIQAVTDSHRLVPGAAPSSTVALLRWTDTRADALVLGDSTIAVITGEREEVLTDQRLAAVAPELRREYRRLLADHGYDEEHQRTMRQILEEERRRRNQPGGYWIAEADPQAARQAVQRTWSTDALDAVVLASDGVSRGTDLYDTFPSWCSLTAHARRHGPDAVLDAIRRDERTDPDGRRWPRSKPSDDQALFVVTFQPDRTPTR